jgi:hypothetical protein
MPPSARSAAPFVAEACFRTDVDHHVGDFVDAGEALQQRTRPVLPDELAGRFRFGLAVLFRQILHEGLDALRHRWTRQYRVDGHAGAARKLGKAARDRQLRRLGRAVMDHLGRDVQRGFGGDKDDAAPVALEHARQIGARQPHARHHIDLEETVPVLIWNIEKTLRFENTGIVDEDVDLRKRRQKLLAAGRSRDVGDNAADLAARHRLRKARDRRIDPRLAPAIEHNFATCRRHTLGNRIANAGSRAGDQGRLPGKIDFHGASPSSLVDGDIGGGSGDRNRRAEHGCHPSSSPNEKRRPLGAASECKS